MQRPRPVLYSQNLEHSLQRAAGLAKEQNREYATLEDLLIALTDDPDAVRIMSASLVDFGRLRRDLVAYADADKNSIPPQSRAFTVTMARHFDFSDSPSLSSTFSAR